MLYAYVGWPIFKELENVSTAQSLQLTHKIVFSFPRRYFCSLPLFSVVSSCSRFIINRHENVTMLTLHLIKPTDLGAMETHACVKYL